MQILVLEASTSSAKAMIYRPETGILRLCTRPYSAAASDVCTHDADAVYAMLLEIGKEAAQGESVDAVALVGTWHTAMCLDRQLRPASRVYLWTSTAAAPVARQVRQDQNLARRLYSATGCMPHAMYPIYHIRYLLEQGLAAPDSLFSTEDAYFFHKLTGQWRVSQSTASGSGLLDIHSLTYSPLALSVAGIQAAQLPPVCGHRFTVPLCREAAALLGIPAGTPVCAGHPDGAMNQLGSAALRPGCMTLSVGTSAAVRMTAPTSDTSHLGGNWFYYAPSSWLIGAATGATNNIDWFRRTLAPGQSFGVLEQGGGIQPDSPRYLPFLYGERCPGWNDQAAGQFMGLKGSHTIQDLYAAVQEGIVFNIFQCYRQVCAAHGTPDRVLLSGGVLKSARWTQMLADVLERDLETSQIDQASMLGGAAVALHAIGALDRLDQFRVQDETPHLICPDPEKRDLYRRRYAGYLQDYRQGNAR